jgi:hypothetical protein
MLTSADYDDVIVTVAQPPVIETTLRRWMESVQGARRSSRSPRRGVARAMQPHSTRFRCSTIAVSKADVFSAWPAPSAGRVGAYTRGDSATQVRELYEGSREAGSSRLTCGHYMHESAVLLIGVQTMRL